MVEDLFERGFVSFRPGDRAGWIAVHGLLVDLASEAERAFRRGALADSADPTSGQDGFTSDGNESPQGLVELRSHLMIPARLPEGHPLLALSPDFYASSQQSTEALGVDPETRLRIFRFLDSMTIEFFEQLESQLAMPFGSLSSQLALGERLLRIQLYPEFSNPRLVDVRVDSGSGPLTVRGVRNYITDQTAVRVSPHQDTGYWTWQLFANDFNLRFENESAWFTSRETEIEASIVGNACTFLELDLPMVSAPLHWVDVPQDSAAHQFRVSISYFVHPRPSRVLGGRPAGLRLFDALRALGYVTEDKVTSVRRLLAQSELSDESLLEACHDWEQDGGSLGEFGVGVSRYMINETS